MADWQPQSRIQSKWYLPRVKQHFLIARIAKRGFSSHAPIVAESPRFSMRKSALSQRLATDHLNLGSVIWACFAGESPKRVLIHEYFQDNCGISSCPPKFLDISSACLKISSLSG